MRITITDYDKDRKLYHCRYTDSEQVLLDVSRTNLPKSQALVGRSFDISNNVKIVNNTLSPKKGEITEVGVLQEAVRLLCRELKRDEDLYRVYQANIAMAYFDEARRQKSRDSLTTLHRIGNQAAKNFLDLLINE